MAKKDLKNALGALLDKAYSNGPLADAAAQMSEFYSPAPISATTEEPQAPEPSSPKDEHGAPKLKLADRLEIAPGDVLDPAYTGSASIHPSNSPSIQQSESAIHPVIQPAIHAAGQPPNHPIVHPSGQSSIRPSIYPSIQPLTERHAYLPLTVGQGKVMLYLVEGCAGATNVETISAATQVPVGTVKDGLRALIKYGYMTGKWRIVQHDFHGFGYSLNHQICTEYVAKVKGAEQPSIHPPSHASSQPSIRPSFQPSVHPSVPLSSSSSLIKLTTTSEGGVLNLDHPELDFWRDRALSLEMVTGWMREFNISSDQILQALKHAAFDVPLQEEKRGEQIDPFNWFYAGLKRFGTYRRPVGYKPLEQILLEEAKAEREEKERLARDLSEERIKAEEATQELKFQQFMANPTSAEYQNLKAQVSSGGLPLSGKMLESAMRQAFIDVHR